MYSVTREPMTDADRESLGRVLTASRQTAWIPLGTAMAGLAIAIFCGSVVARPVVADFRTILAAVFFFASVAVFVCAMWVLIARFAERSRGAGRRDGFEALRESRTVEIVHFRADMAWRIPEDPFDNDDDRLGVLYRVGSDAFVATPLYQLSDPGSESRVPAEVVMRRTPLPDSVQLTEFKPVGTQTLVLQEQLGGWEDTLPGWAEGCGKKLFVGAPFRLIELPESWQTIVRGS